MGCKFIQMTLIGLMIERINRYIVGCKFGSSESMISGGSELIDT